MDMWTMDYLATFWFFFFFKFKYRFNYLLRLANKLWFTNGVLFYWFWLWVLRMRVVSITLVVLSLQYVAQMTL